MSMRLHYHPIPAFATAALLAFSTAAGALAATNPPPAVATNTPAGPTVPAGREGAREAQRLYERGRYAEAAAAYLAATADAGRRSETDYRYNAALSYYRAGRFQEAAEGLRALSTSAQGDRLDASLALGAALYSDADRHGGQDVTNLTERAQLLKAAGEAFQQSARSRDNNLAARRNLGVVLGALPQAEEQARIAQLLAQHAQTPAGDLAGQILASERQVIEQAPAALTNDSPDQIALLEALAAKQKAAADLWIPLKGKLLQMLAQQSQGTNAQIQAAQANQVIEATRDSMLNASSALRDLDGSGYGLARQSEAAIYQFWKSIAPYPALLQEDLYAQSNILSRIRTTFDDESARRETAAWQQEARSLTGLFAERFVAAVPEGGIPAPVATNAAGAAVTNAAGGLSAEDRKKILELASQAALVQSNAVAAISAHQQPESAAAAVESARLLKEIEKLLPKNSSSSQQQQQSNDQKSPEQQPKPEEQPKPQENQPPEPQPKPEEQPKPQDLDQQKLQQLLNKALQREQEHEEKLRQRREYLPPSPGTRDW